jgi:predicted enzyme related to lactoylglutathione lyase
MGERTGYAQGTFCWVDVGTTNAEGAKAFYTGLFGWEADDMPAGEDGTYTMLRLDGKEVAALYEMPAEQRAQGVPANWLSYVSVEDAGASTERAGELGAAVLVEPFDVMDVGRMAVLQDPTGAVFALWQPGRSFGASLVNDPGSLCWNQLTTDDTDRAQAFYSEFFGWKARGLEGSDAPYWTLMNGEATNGGMMAIQPGMDVPPNWMAYFATDDLDQAVARVRELGGGVLAPPMDVPAGRIAVVQDPQGAAFGFFEGETQP